MEQGGGGELSLSLLLLLTRTLSRLSHVFTNPEEFDPERYAPGREEDKAQPFSHTTFGGGRHGCMGETFAYLQVPTEGVHSCMHAQPVLFWFGGV